MLLIFNAKALVVGVVVIVATVVGTKMGSFEGGAIVGGILGLLLSIKFSTPYEGYLKLPHVFFIPTHLICVLIIVMSIAGWRSEHNKTPEMKAAEAAKKNISDSIDADVKVLQSVQYTGDTGCIHEADRYMQEYETKQLQPENNSYLVKYNRDSTKALVLMKTGKFKILGKGRAEEQLKIIMSYFLEENAYLIDKQLYFGLYSGDKLYLTYTPSGLHTASFTHDQDELTGFYEQPTTTVKSAQVK